MSIASPTIYVDARCLQDPQYQFRGIGHHVASLLRNRLKTAARDCCLVALTDGDLPAMPETYCTLFDEVSHCLNPSLKRIGNIFVQGSPMTHDPRFSLRFVHHPNLLTASIVYDFIPLDWPGYLTQTSHRIDYLSKLTRLKSSGLFLPISRYSARRLIELTGVGEADILVTGASIRSSLFELARTLQGAGPSARNDTPYFLTIGGGDPRKNTETAVRAVRGLNMGSSKPVQLRIIGHYSGKQKADLQRIAAGGDFLDFLPNVDDRSLVELYSASIGTIAPSHIEGFSLPVVEAALCGSPVIASKCPAHEELISQPDALFPADDPNVLTERLAQVLKNRDFRESLLRAQAPLAEKFCEEAVGSRFWGAVLSRFQRNCSLGGPAVRKKTKPRVAVLSPFPPDQSGVARFTERTLRAAQKHFEIDLFTDAARPLVFDDGIRDAGGISIYALIKNRYHSIVSVLGNSRFHIPIFELFERYGGPCIMHDSRLTHIYFHRLGEAKFLEFASRLLGRIVHKDEVRFWIDDQQLPTLFVEPIIERAKPLIVHTRRYQELLHERYGISAELATFPPNFQFTEEELGDERRAVARQTLGIDDGSFLISSFGIVDGSKGPLACIVALEQLRFWNIPGELFFIGKACGLEQELTRVATDFGVVDRVHFFHGFVSEDQYRTFMIASDAAVQLRTYDLGQPSAALADCIGAGLPTVASRSLAETCDGPSYVARIPDHISSLLLAERLAEIWDRRPRRVETAQERIHYCRQHSFETYAKRLSEILDL